ncbi:MAG TPA: hypothetical protein VNV82_13165 [Bryobacteraceae bacterium]|nr:hypothetical protein [Bryobacteraceae bacterium]
MSKRKQSYPPAWVESATLYALPYRPTGSLRATAEPTDYWRGWKRKEFVDDRGNLYERQRDGEWERWYRITEKVGTRRKVLYRYRAERKPIEWGDVLDRQDDLVFLYEAFGGWLAEAEDRGIYGPKALTGIHSTLKKLGNVLDELGREVEILRPPDPVKM